MGLRSVQDTAAFGSPTIESNIAIVAGAGAGQDETIPRTFLIFADLVALAAALLVTAAAAPLVQRTILALAPHSRWLSALVLPRTPTANFPPLGEIAWMFLVIAPETVVFLELLGGYGQLLDQSRARLLISNLLAPLVAMSFLILAMFAMKIETSSRVVIFTLALASITGLLVCRGLLRWYQRTRLAAGVYAKNVVVVGQMMGVEWIVQHFEARVPKERFRLAGWLSVDPFVAAAGASTPPLLGTSDELGTLLVREPIHEVIAIQSANDSAWLKRVIDDCDYFRVRLRIVPAALLYGTPRDLQLVFRSEPLRLPEVVLAPAHHGSEALFFKRVIDVLVAATLLVLLAPLFAAIAIAIKLTTPRLPVFYAWRVVGLKGRPFTGYKFTTMFADADERKQALASRNEMRGPVFKIKNDPRLTPLGRFLRKYSLNELPQLWSVLKGDMSLVGPRPAFRHELLRYELWHKRKLCVQPGITCLWQVSGRNRISDFDKWVQLDLQYIDQWSLWLDLRILIRTFWTVVAGTGS